MQIAFRLSVLAAALSCTVATPVFAQEANVSTEQELAAMRAQLQALTSRINELEADLAESRAVSPSTDSPIVGDTSTVSAQQEAAPATQLATSSGWSFKPRGRLMFDAGTVSVPDAVAPDDGFGNELRRARIGASGDLPGGFGYKFEIDFAGDEVAPRAIGICSRCSKRPRII